MIIHTHDEREYHTSAPRILPLITTTMKRQMSKNHSRKDTKVPRAVWTSALA